jgi:hypothetical protein
MNRLKCQQFATTQPTGINQRKYHFVFDVTVCGQDQFYFFLLKKHWVKLWFRFDGSLSISIWFPELLKKKEYLMAFTP